MSIERYQCDVLVVGGGIAGAMAAIRACELGRKVILVEKSFFGRSGCSALASGEFKAFFPGDDIERWLGIWGGSFVNMRLARAAIHETANLFRRMEEWGVRWVKENGEIVRVRSGGVGATDKICCLMADGGPQLMNAIRAHAVGIGVEVINRTYVTDLVTSDACAPTNGSVVGAVGFDTGTGEPRVITAAATIVCAGPYRFPYPTATGRGLPGMPVDAAPNGHAMMMRTGAVMGKLEVGGLSPMPAEAFSAPGLELLGGLGGRFLTADGQELVPSGGDGEAPRRSALGHAFTKEQQAGRHVYLDLRHLTPEEIRLAESVIPIVMANFRLAGFDPTRDLVPYTCELAAVGGVSGGGAQVDEHGRTTVPGLYAAGNNCDGAYLTMSQALPGAAVTGWWAGSHAAGHVSDTPTKVGDECVNGLLERALAPLKRPEGHSYRTVHDAVEAILEHGVGRILSGPRMRAAIDAVQQIDFSQTRATDPHELVKVHNLQNFCEAFEAVLTVMDHRTESRGNIVREDYPYTDNERWLCYTRLRRKSRHGFSVWDDARPTTSEYLAVAATRELHPFFAVPAS